MNKKLVVTVTIAAVIIIGGLLIYKTDYKPQIQVSAPGDTTEVADGTELDQEESSNSIHEITDDGKLSEEEKENDAIVEGTDGVVEFFVGFMESLYRKNNNDIEDSPIIEKENQGILAADLYDIDKEISENQGYLDPEPTLELLEITISEVKASTITYKDNDYDGYDLKYKLTVKANGEKTVSKDLYSTVIIINDNYMVVSYNRQK